MSKAPRIPVEVWESHKETIRDLYQREELKDVIRIMDESYQFRATYVTFNSMQLITINGVPDGLCRDKQYIRQLGKWQFKKYTTSEKWQHAAQVLSKRQIEGKESELRINGKPVLKKKLKKELARYVAPTMQPAQIAGTNNTPTVVAPSLPRHSSTYSTRFCSSRWS
jgi:hypothetical protein